MFSLIHSRIAPSLLTKIMSSLATKPPCCESRNSYPARASCRITIASSSVSSMSLTRTSSSVMRQVLFSMLEAELRQLGISEYLRVWPVSQMRGVNMSWVLGLGSAAKTGLGAEAIHFMRRMLGWQMFSRMVQEGWMAVGTSFQRSSSKLVTVLFSSFLLQLPIQYYQSTLATIKPSENLFHARILLPFKSTHQILYQLLESMSDDGDHWTHDNYGDEDDFEHESIDEDQVLGLVKGEQADLDESQDANSEEKDQDSSQDISLSEDGALLQQPEQPQKKSTHRITPALLSKYEKAAVLGKRAMQISKNSPIYTVLSEKEKQTLSPLEIAEIELRDGKIPFILHRPLPNGQYEEWRLDQLRIV